MEDTIRERFKLSRPRAPVNEAAMFVENSMVITQQESHVYSDHLDRFVSVEEAIKQQKIRYFSTEI